MDYQLTMRFAHASAVASAHHLWPSRPYVAPAKRGRRVAIGARPARAATDESIMNPRSTQEQIGLFPTLLTAPAMTSVDAIRAEAIRARDAAIAAGVRRFLRAAGKSLAAFGNLLATYPERRAILEDLRGLTDRELADIGLTRGDIGRVFNPGFRLPGRPANGKAPVTARAQAA